MLFSQLGGDQRLCLPNFSLIDDCQLSGVKSGSCLPNFAGPAMVLLLELAYRRLVNVTPTPEPTPIELGSATLPCPCQND